MAFEFTDGNFKENVVNNPGLVVVDFWAEWCGPCRALAPVINELATEYDGKVKIGKLNVDLNPVVGSEYGITSIPAVLFFKNGAVVDKQIGAVPKSVLDKKIKAHI
ncbi:MAG: thioredoxin [Sediminibacterium sp.]|nr:thioredoxin [Sediminibacterium sp.]